MLCYNFEHVMPLGVKLYMVQNYTLHTSCARARVYTDVNYTNYARTTYVPMRIIFRNFTYNVKHSNKKLCLMLNTNSYV